MRAIIILSAAAITYGITYLVVMEAAGRFVGLLAR